MKVDKTKFRNTLYWYNMAKLELKKELKMSMRESSKYWNEKPIFNRWKLKKEYNNY